MKIFGQIWVCFYSSTHHWAKYCIVVGISWYILLGKLSSKLMLSFFDTFLIDQNWAKSWMIIRQLGILAFWLNFSNCSITIWWNTWWLLCFLSRFTSSLYRLLGCWYWLPTDIKDYNLFQSITASISKFQKILFSFPKNFLLIAFVDYKNLISFGTTMSCKVYKKEYFILDLLMIFDVQEIWLMELIFDVSLKNNFLMIHEFELNMLVIP